MQEERAQEIKNAKQLSRVTEILVVWKGHKDANWWDKEENISNRLKRWNNKSECGGARAEVLLTNIDLLSYIKEYKENAKRLKDEIQENKNVLGIDSDNMLDIMPMLQDVKV